MIDLDKLYNEFEDDIIYIVDALSMTVPLNSIQLKSTFTKDELIELEELIGKVRKATTENEKTLLLMRQGNIILKLLSVLGVAL